MVTSIKCHREVKSSEDRVEKWLYNLNSTRLLYNYWVSYKEIFSVGKKMNISLTIKNIVRLDS